MVTKRKGRADTSEALPPNSCRLQLWLVPSELISLWFLRLLIRRRSLTLCYGQLGCWKVTYMVSRNASVEMCSG